jgi:HSP20 family protein
LSEPWWNRKKKKDLWFDDIYEELKRLRDLIDEAVQKAFETSSETPPVHSTWVQGFSTKIGPDGKPMIQEQNNRKSGPKKTKVSEDQEPLFDLIEDSETIVVLAALPGVQVNAIDIRATRYRLTVSVDTHNLKCHKELKLPARVIPKSAYASYNNGVLEVKLKKLE